MPDVRCQCARTLLTSSQLIFFFFLLVQISSRAYIQLSNSGTHAYSVGRCRGAHNAILLASFILQDYLSAPKKT